ncbi:sodium:proton exchanger [Streptomyces sp. CB02923]|uniref:cation:proton antiporter n=1 Tax=Streptomyces sp. CB02923 TaxID=1718985 RepID=UPI00093E6A2D|nr:cation:proton antiporter [Streptomyces sp. CB02923]OKI04582.1 sodium:proton exchanger [Streptomyces sp. CB02923]
MSQSATLVLIMTIAVAAPLLAYGLGRWLPVPLVIFEIVLGILIGPDVLGWAHSGEVINALSDLGLATLMFIAGYEIEFAKVRGDTLKRAGYAWIVTLALSLAITFGLAAGDLTKAIVIGTALTSTALGTVLPVLRDSGDLGTRFGSVMMATGAVGEFGPIIAMALLLSGRDPGESTILLFAFALLTAGAVYWALKPSPMWFYRIIARTLHSSSQFAIRLFVLLLAVMLGISQVFGLDILLGAFAAGVIMRLVLHEAAPDSSQEILGRLEAMGFGFLVPLFFIVTGVEFDLSSLFENGSSLLLLPLFLVLLLVVRGLPLVLLAPRDLGRKDRAALMLYGSTALPLVVAITTIGQDSGVLDAGEAAAMVGAAMISVLVFPVVAMRLRSGAEGLAPLPEGPREGASESW